MNDITAVLAQMGRGKVLEAINNEFQNIVTDVTDNGGTGELTVKIKVKGTAHDTDGRLTEVAVTHTMQSKRPKRDLGPSTFFLTRENVLTRNNPEQAELFEAEIRDSIKEAK